MGGGVLTLGAGDSWNHPSKPMLCSALMGYNSSMTAEECHDRASICAANAALARSEPVASEFLRLAAQWRAMAGRVILLGSLGEPGSAVEALNAIALPSS